MTTLEEAVDMLVSTNKDIDLMARFLSVDAHEVHAALEGADEDSADAVALRLLAKYNPIQDDNTNQEHG
jgi:NACalpha-BTF3-like transcription factor